MPRPPALVARLPLARGLAKLAVSLALRHELRGAARSCLAASRALLGAAVVDAHARLRQPRGADAHDGDLDRRAAMAVLDRTACDASRARAAAADDARAGAGRHAGRA